MFVGGRYRSLAHSVKVVRLSRYDRQLDRHARRVDQAFGDLSQGSPHAARSGRARLSGRAPTHEGAAPGGSRATLQHQPDVVHVAGAGPRRRAVGGGSEPDRRRADADRRGARASLPHRARSAAGGLLQGRRAGHAPPAARARCAGDEPGADQDRHLGRRRLEPRRRRRADRLRRACAGGSQHPSHHVRQLAGSSGAARLGERRPLRGRCLQGGCGTRRRHVRGCRARRRAL